MTKANEVPKKFRPERPIYLNEENTGFKTKDQVIVAIEDLRGRGWLVAYNEKVRPLHMSFNDEKQFQEFKKDATDLKIKLKSPVIKADDLEELEEEEKQGQIIEDGNAKSSYEDPSGKVHIE